MIFQEFNMKTALEVAREEALEDGRILGIKEGKSLGLTIDEIQKL